MNDADPPLCPQACPYVVHEQAGIKAWCTCGRSAKQPYCDGSHAGTRFRPKVVTVAEAKTIAWCGCKQTQNPPFCDGSHSRA